MNKRKIVGWSIIGMMLFAYIVIIAVSLGWEGVLFLAIMFAVMGLAFLAMHLLID